MKISNLTMPDYKLLENKKVLIVDDNIMNRILARRTMANYDILITEVQNGKEAIDEIIKDNFDIILMDIQMPVMNGIQATRIIRKELKLSTPIVALTGSALKEQIDQCLSAGMDAYIVKPFNKEILLQTLLNVSQQKTSVIQHETKDREPQHMMDYDISKIEEISRGDKEFVNRMIGLFVKTIPSSLQKMKMAFQEKDFKTLNAITHRIKPSIDDLGITQISEEIKQVEFLSLEKPNSELIPQFLVKIENVLNQVIDQLTNELD
ncbi:MAG: CheY-like chemotaxis protein/HPt (histidine-containing phosphotransfer) domain-containing protein [Saprospiraceae bacterium]|jgi:CheY-like chemotaxis protein/HPt (histidine-containing phosphotransfer) domain-containing protein